MKKLFFILAVFFSLAFARHPELDKLSNDDLGFTVVINGEGWNNRTVFIPAASVLYSNLYFDFKDDPRAKRTDLTGFTSDKTIFINIAAPIHKKPGSFTFTEDSIPVYMGFTFTCSNPNNPQQPQTYLPGKITITISKYGNVGEYIEGNFSGIVHSEKQLTINGTFKVKRLKDRTDQTSNAEI
jgi:hypothetical protein